MSELYATIPVSARKTVPTARGHKNTGITSEVCAWTGKIVSKIEWDAAENDYRFTVSMEPHHGKGDTMELMTGLVGSKETVERLYNK